MSSEYFQTRLADAHMDFWAGYYVASRKPPSEVRPLLIANIGRDGARPSSRPCQAAGGTTSVSSRNRQETLRRFRGTHSRPYLFFTMFCMALALCLLSGPSAFAHAMHAFEVQGGLGVRVEYDDGYPATHAEVRVYAPDEETHPYAEGITDAEGYFVFFPTSEGPWRLVVDDGMGHRVEKNLAPDPAHHSFVYLPPRRIRWMEALFGVALILALFAGYGRWVAVRKGKTD